jgi:hypothetical protein
MPKYSIHDNGATPFWVDVSGKSVTVLKNMNKDKMIDGKFTVIEYPPTILFTIDADEVFIGKTSPTGPTSPPGTAILCRVGSTYTYIGKEIYDFSTDDVINKFYSDLGNSDVPYPYAIGEKYIYIMLDKVAIEKSFFNMKEDIYKQYYENMKKLKKIKLKTKEKKTKTKTEKKTKTKTKTKKTLKKYLTRDSPPYPANDYCRKKMKGNDGLMYVSTPDKNGVCKWIKV